MAWVLGAAVGRGSSGEIHLAFRRSYPPSTFVVKSSPLSSSSLLQHEESILSNLQKHPQIISCLGHEITNNPPGEQFGEIYNLFLEYASGGSIADAIHHAGGTLPEPTIRRHLRSILLGLTHIHNMGYVHCDIKPQNILIFANEAKIADFGLAKKSAEKSEIEVRGSPMYMAPESFAREEYETAADVWAVGCTAAEMFSGRPPWRGVNGIWDLLMRVGFGDEVPEIPPAMSEEGKDFLRRCFVKDPRKRWTAEMLLSHPFVGVEKDGMICEVLYTTPTSVMDFSLVSVQSDISGTGNEVSARERIRGLVSEEISGWANCLEDDGWINVREDVKITKIRKKRKKYKKKIQKKKRKKNIEVM